VRMQIAVAGLGELVSGNRPDQVLVCYGLGSCVGLALHDPVARVGVLAHVVLPDSRLGRGVPDRPGKFADTAVPAAIEEAVRLGAVPARLVARIVGGARMLPVAGIPGMLDIGDRNVEAVQAALARAGIRLIGQDTGGTYGRTVHFFVGTGRLMVSTVGRGEREL